jgi:hypothetical protein
MSDFNKYCYIGDSNTNVCANPEYNRVYYNKDSEVSKLNYYPAPPSITPGPIIPKKYINPVDSLQNNIPGSVPDNLNNNSYPFSKYTAPSITMNSTLTKSLNYTSISPNGTNTLPFNNTTLNYASTGHQNGNNTTFTYK